MRCCIDSAFSLGVSSGLDWISRILAFKMACGSCIRHQTMNTFQCRARSRAARQPVNTLYLIVAERSRKRCRWLGANFFRLVGRVIAVFFFTGDHFGADRHDPEASVDPKTRSLAPYKCPYVWSILEGWVAGRRRARGPERACWSVRRTDYTPQSAPVASRASTRRHRRAPT